MQVLELAFMGRMVCSQELHQAGHPYAWPALKLCFALGESLEVTVCSPLRMALSTKPQHDLSTTT